MRPGDFFADLRKFSEFTARGRYPRRRLLGFGAIALGVAAALGYAGYLYWYGQTHVSTDDAYITGHIAPVSARVAGPVVAVLVDDNQDVKAGAVLVRLDPRDYEVALAQARAAVETARGDLGNASATVPLTSETTESGLRQAEAALGVAQHGNQVAEHDLEERRSALASKQAAVAAADAAVRAAEADFERDRLDRERSAELYKRELVAKQDLDHADAAYNNARATLDVVREKLAQARADVQQAAAAVRSQEAAAAQAGQRVREAASRKRPSRSARSFSRGRRCSRSSTLTPCGSSPITRRRSSPTSGGASGRWSRWTPIPASSSGRGWTRSRPDRAPSSRCCRPRTPPATSSRWCSGCR